MYARYRVAIGFMVGTDRCADWRLTRLARHFPESKLLHEDGLHAVNGALRVADRRSSSTIAQVVMVVVALIWSSLTIPYAVDVAQSSWEGRVVAGVDVLSWAVFLPPPLSRASGPADSV